MLSFEQLLTALMDLMGERVTIDVMVPTQGLSIAQISGTLERADDYTAPVAGAPGLEVDTIEFGFAEHDGTFSIPRDALQQIDWDEREIPGSATLVMTFSGGAELRIYRDDDET